MLTEEETRRIEEELRHYPNARGLCQALKVIQQRRGWVADEHIADLAPMLGMTVHELDGVASFYPFIFRKPVGRHLIFVCEGLSCWVMGYEAVIRAFTNGLGFPGGIPQKTAVLRSCPSRAWASATVRRP